MYTLDKLDAPSISTRPEFSGDKRILALAETLLSELCDEDAQGLDEIKLAQDLQDAMEAYFDDPARWVRL